MEEEKKVIHIGVGGLFLMIIAIVIITVACVYFVTEKQQTSEQLGEQNNGGVVNNNVQANIVTGELTARPAQENAPMTTGTATTDSAKKLDASKEWVYDATYDNGLDTTSYKYANGQATAEFNVKVPYININSEDARKANTEIEKIYNDLAVEFTNQKKTQAQEDFVIGLTAEASYESYVNGNIVSVVVKYATSSTDVPHYEYVAYNFDLNTLKLLSNEDVYKVAGYTSSNIGQKVEGAVIGCYLGNNNELNVVTNVELGSNNENMVVIIK